MSPLLPFDGDVAAEQLYDELFARVWQLFRLGEGLAPDPEDDAVRLRLARAALSMVGELRRGTPQAAADTIAVLWPTGCPDARATWWRTPLGMLLVSQGLRPAA